MPGIELKLGDEVVYRDRDRILWGPWKIVGIRDEEVTVMISETISYSIDAGLIRRAEPRKLAV